MPFGSKDMAIENARVIAKLEAQVETLEMRLDDARQDSKELRGMLSRAQDALIAKEAPEAYRDQKVAEWEAAYEPTEAELATADKLKRKAAAETMYLENIEQPLFKSADDMIEILTRPQQVPQGASLHNNGES